MSSEFEKFKDHTGTERLLTKLPYEGLKGCQTYDNVLKASPLIPRSEYIDVDNRDVFGFEKWFYDQLQHGSCSGQAVTSTIIKTRHQQGLPFVKLSPTYLYAQCNGGRDQGSVIAEILAAAKAGGTCRLELNDQNTIYWNQVSQAAKADAPNYKISEAYRLTSFEEICDAILKGFFIVCGIYVGRNFEQTDANGVAGVTRAQPNHAVMVDGLKILPSGEVLLDMANSWSFNWGYNGRIYLRDKHFAYVEGDHWAIRTVGQSPADPGTPALVV